jgi:protease II
MWFSFFAFETMVSCDAVRLSVTVQMSCALTAEFFHPRWSVAQILLPRMHDVEYSVQHWHGHLFMVKRTTDTPNSEVLMTSLEDPSQQRSLRPHREDVKIEDMLVFDKHIAVLERVNGLSECHVFELSDPSSAANVRPFQPYLHT